APGYGTRPSRRWRTASARSRRTSSSSVLALYTDGLVETPGVDIGTATAELSGRLARSRPGDLDALADGLIRHVKDPAHRTDDVALLLVRHEP
ncbi:SpoIIE family protein phosphatase, partial [Streptomyces sp. NPDC000963]